MQPQHELNRIRVLLVNDSILFLQAFKRFLNAQDGDFDIQIAAGGHDALELAPRFEPQLILLDLNMPNAGGLELLPKLRVLVPDARIVVVTFRTPQEVRARAFALGADGFVTKSNLSDELMPVIWELLPQSKRRAA